MTTERIGSTEIEYMRWDIYNAKDLGAEGLIVFYYEGLNIISITAPEHSKDDAFNATFKCARYICTNMCVRHICTIKCARNFCANKCVPNICTNKCEHNICTKKCASIIYTNLTQHNKLNCFLVNDLQDMRTLLDSVLTELVYCNCRVIAMNGICVINHPDIHTRPEKYQVQFIKEWLSLHPDAFDKIMLIDGRNGFIRANDRI